MKKLIVTAFCAAFTLPTMQAMAAGNDASGNNADSAVQQKSQRNSQVPTNSPTGHGQEYMGSKTDSQQLKQNGSSSMQQSQGNATDSAVQQKSQRNSQVPANNPTGHGQEYMGSKSDSQSVQGKSSGSSAKNPNGNGPEETGSAAAVTDTGRQGHSAQMEEKVSPGGPTEKGDSPGKNNQ